MATTTYAHRKMMTSVEFVRRMGVGTFNVELNASLAASQPFVEIFFVNGGQFDVRPDDALDDPRFACATVDPSSREVRYAARGPAGMSRTFAVVDDDGNNDDGPKSFLRLNVMFNNDANTDVTVKLRMPQRTYGGNVSVDEAAICFDLYTHENVAEGDPRKALRRRACATFFVRDLDGDSSRLDLCDYAPVVSTESPEKCEMEKGVFGSVTWIRSPLEITRRKTGDATFEKSLTTGADRQRCLDEAKTTYRAQEKYIMDTIANPQQQAMYKQAAVDCGRNERTTHSHMLSPWNFATRRTGSTYGYGYVYAIGRPTRFRADPHWLRHQFTTAFRYYGRSPRVLEANASDAHVLGMAVSAWLSAKPYLEDRIMDPQTGAFTPADAMYNVFLTGGGDCEDTNTMVVAVMRHVAEMPELPVNFFDDDDDGYSWTDILNSAKKLARMYVPFACTCAASPALKDGDDFMKAVELPIHMFAVSIPKFKVAQLLKDSDKIDVKKMNEIWKNDIKASKNLPVLLHEATGWVSSDGGRLSMSLAREEVTRSFLRTNKIGGVPSAVMPCFPTSFFSQTTIHGNETANHAQRTRPSHRIHVMITTLLTDVFLEDGLVYDDNAQHQTYGPHGKASLGWRLSKDNCTRTWSVDAAVLWGGECSDGSKFSDLSLHPTYDIDQAVVREALMAERPAPLLRYSRTKARAREAIAANVRAALCASGDFVVCTFRRNCLLYTQLASTTNEIVLAAACARRDVVALAVQCDAIETPEGVAELCKRVQREVREHRVRAVVVDDGVAWTISMVFIGS